VAMPIPESTHDLFERPILCALSTINPDGQPHTVPVWCDFDGTYVRVNSPAAARKARNMKVGSKVTVLIIDPQQSYHWVEVMGHVIEIRDNKHGATEHINSLSAKYTGNPVYQPYGRSGENRLMVLIEPDEVHGR
jgi:PPOX class probable F420-dependent enzyme